MGVQMSNDTSQDSGQAPPQPSKSVSQYPPNTDTPPSSFNQMPSSGTNPGTHLKYYAAAGILVVVIVALLIFFVRSNPTAFSEYSTNYNYKECHCKGSLHKHHGETEFN